MRRFDLLPEYLCMLRCFEYDGVINGKEVRYLHIFSTYRAKDQHLSISNITDLEQHPEMLLFKGHIDKQGNVYMADRSPPLKHKKVI